MQSEIYNIRKSCAAFNTQHRAFSLLAVLGGTFDALYAGRTFALHGIGQQPAKPQKVTRSRTPATRYRKSRNGAIHTRKQ